MLLQCTKKCTFVGMGKAFRMDLVIQPGDIDALSHVNNVVYLQWVQDVSAAHWFELSTPDIREQYAWVVLRHEIDYLKSAKWGDELYAETWVGETAGFRSVRWVNIFNKQNDLLVRASTTWCMIDTRQFKPARLTPEILAILDQGRPN